jgi:lipopolysaccharide/colanic/teichoic acid biosynthesis glycosyltransferase
MIALERKRSDRSKEPFLLMLVEIGNHQDTSERDKVLSSMIAALMASSRDTDVVGWYKDQKTIGVMFTGLLIVDKDHILSTILGRVSKILGQELTFTQFSQISLSFHFFPDDWSQNDSGPSNPALYPDLLHPGDRKRSLLIVKRTIDMICSGLALVVLSPIFALIAIAIKSTSRGPVFFKQKRVGQFGRQFTFFKFRSMLHGNDPGVHKDFVIKLITNGAESQSGAVDNNVYKLTNDSRITRVGKFIRRTSLDELPQIFNVLRGDMSLVGPRPAIPYELAAYQTWHRRRILEAKPGVTGLWQVTGRSRVKFDDMVRLDLRYATSWSLLLDLKILMRTPLAVIKGAGAY